MRSRAAEGARLLCGPLLCCLCAHPCVRASKAGGWTREGPRTRRRSQSGTNHFCQIRVGTSAEESTASGIYNATTAFLQRRSNGASEGGKGEREKSRRQQEKHDSDREWCGASLFSLNLT